MWFSSCRGSCRPLLSGRAAKRAVPVIHQFAFMAATAGFPQPCLAARTDHPVDVGVGMAGRTLCRNLWQSCLRRIEFTLNCPEEKSQTDQQQQDHISRPEPSFSAHDSDHPPRRRHATEWSGRNKGGFLRCASPSQLFAPLRSTDRKDP